MFKLICDNCGSQDVEVQKSISGVSFECQNPSCLTEAELTYDDEQKPFWEEI